MIDRIGWRKFTPVEVNKDFGKCPGTLMIPFDELNKIN